MTEWCESTGVNEIVQSYIDYLLVRYRVLHDLYLRTLNADREAAWAEAVVFSWLRASESLSVELEQNPSTGGVDFNCVSRGRTSFVV
jgi:hypothetical protein